MKIGIMGGTFNPIHQGHLIQSEIVRQEKGLDKIIFIPTSNPPHKKGSDVLDSQYRLEMVELSIESNPYFHLSKIEVERPGLSYTVDTLKELKAIYPEDQLYFIIGADSLLNIHKWKDYQYILSNAKILVMDRHRTENVDIIQLAERYNTIYNNSVEIIPSPIIEISSTMIRERKNKGLSIKYMVMESVESYIEKNKLYIGVENHGEA